MGKKGFVLHSGGYQVITIYGRKKPKRPLSIIGRLGHFH
jgi:hypothetical protein